jgi:hypothetical protein
MSERETCERISAQLSEEFGERLRALHTQSLEAERERKRLLVELEYLGTLIQSHAEIAGFEAGFGSRRAECAIKLDGSVVFSLADN